jgi:uncharacterized membrane protein YkoI
MKYDAIVAVIAVTAAGTAAAATRAPNVAGSANDSEVSLIEAIHAAERVGDGRAVDAETRGNKGAHTVYSVQVLSNDGRKLTEYVLDADTGRIEQTRNEPLQRLAARVKPAEVRSAPTTLSAAIREAEQQTGGEVIDAGTAASGNAVRYELRVASADGSTRDVKVNGATGKMARK